MTPSPSYPGIQQSFEGPFYRYYDENATAVSDLPHSALKPAAPEAEAEDLMRGIRHSGLATVDPTTALAVIQEYIDGQREPFDLILGFSEGASVAAGIVLHQAQTGRGRAFQGAVFICGSPPYDPESHQMVLADEVSQRITIPTAHIMGDEDPTRPASVALSHLCDDQSRFSFKHGKGHTIPWDGASTVRMAAVVREVLDRMPISS